MSVVPDYKPLLRNSINIQRISHQGEDLIVLSCAEGLVNEPLILKDSLTPILANFDGTKTVSEIAALLGSGDEPIKLIRSVLETLDQHYFLNTQRFVAKRQEAFDLFSSLETRPAFFAGKSYSDSPIELRKFVQETLKGSLFISGNNNFKSTFLNKSLPKKKLDNALGVIAPHIDYHRGAKSYGDAYQILKKAKLDVIYTLGTSHQYGSRLFILTNKNFSSPLGTAHCDKKAINNIASLYGKTRAYGDEYLHKNEHSLELQLPFITECNPKAKIVPILVGSFHHYVRKEVLPDTDQNYSDFIHSTVDTINEQIRSGKKIGFIAGVDMAHIGQQFGDTFLINDEILASVRQEDEEYISILERSDRLKLFEHICKTKDARRVCGFPTLYSLLHIFELIELKIRLKKLSYYQAVNEEKTCCVTFSALEISEQR